MKFENFLITDTSGKKSLTATAFLLGFIVVNIKFLLSGIIIAGSTIPVLSGLEYAAAVGGLGAVYVLRRHTDKRKNEGT